MSKHAYAPCHVLEVGCRRVCQLGTSQSRDTNANVPELDCVLDAMGLSAAANVNITAMLVVNEILGGKALPLVIAVLHKMRTKPRVDPNYEADSVVHHDMPAVLPHVLSLGKLAAI
jgi:hypothetical protein